MAWTFERVAGPYGFTEGPVWDGKNILFSDIPNDRILCYDTETGDCDVYLEDTKAANGLKMDTEGRLYVCEMNGRRISRYDEDGYEVITERFEAERYNSPNDLAIDEAGILWFTDPYYGADWEPDDKVLDLDHRSVYRLDLEDPDKLERMTFDTTDPNGILVSHDLNNLYVAETNPDGPAELRDYPNRDDGTLDEYEVLHNFAPHRAIDGMCLDSDGNIVATAGSNESGPGPMIYVFSPTGRILETHVTPDPFPTNCCFGGDDLNELYVTGGEGSLYKAETTLTGALEAPSALSL